VCVLFGHSKYGNAKIDGVEFADLSFVVDDLKLMGALTKALLVIDKSFTILEPSAKQCDYIV
jgi:hypothetical protein